MGQAQGQQRQTEALYTSFCRPWMLGPNRPSQILTKLRLELTIMFLLLGLKNKSSH